MGGGGDADVMRRLERLEQLVGTSNSTVAAGDGSGSTTTADLRSRLLAVQSQLDTLEGGCPGIAQLTSLATQAGIHTAPIAAARAHPPGAPSLPEKAAAVAAALPRITAAAAALQQIDALSPHVDPPYLADMGAMCEQLGTLELAHARCVAAAATLQRDVDALLRAHGAAVAVLSSRFVEWDDALAEVEAHAACGIDT